MDELKVTMQAKAYLDALARGIDPISGEKLPEDTVLNQERLSRCFAYVSKQLQEKIEDEWFQRSCETWREALLASGTLEHVPYSKEPLSLRELLEALGFSGASDSAKKLPQVAVLEWLAREGFLEAEKRPSGGTGYRSTAWGEMAGFSVRDEQTESSRLYVVCGEAAQHLIVNDLDKIIARYLLHFDMILHAWTPELQSRVTYSTEPVGIKAFVEGTINGLLVPACGQKISAFMVSNWLFHEGFLKDAEKRAGRWPTKEGWDLGILAVKVKRKTGETSWNIMYDENAQRFIAENLDKIVAYHRSTVIAL